MIYTVTPYCPNQKKRNLGKELNNIIDLQHWNDDDWIVFLDHDAVWTTDLWYKQIEEAVARNKISGDNVGMFTTMTNRVMNTVQLHGSRISDNHDMRVHRQIGDERRKVFGSKYFHLTKGQPVSGVTMIVNVGIMRKTRFRELQSPLGVDNYTHFDLIDSGFKVALLKGVYVYHWYRGNKDFKDTKHLT